jgi:hypothetical protein
MANFNCARDQFGNRVDIEFTHQVGAMTLNGPLADIEIPGNLLIGLPSQDTLQNLILSRGQSGKPLQ